MMYVVRPEILDKLLADPEWSQRLERARTSKEAEEVVASFAAKMGYRVKKMEGEEAFKP